jgi:hypothetical protein
VILLFAEHHAAVDGPVTRDAYPVELLKRWKRERETANEDADQPDVLRIEGRQQGEVDTVGFESLNKAGESAQVR